MDFGSFLTSLVTSFVIFIVLMLLFTWLSRRPGNEVIYYPSRILRGLDPWEGRRRTRNPLDWIREAFMASEADIVATAGVDSAVYLIFLSSVLGILVLSGIVLLPVLIPTAATDHSVETASNSTSVGTFNNLDRLAMGNVKKRSPRLWPFLLATYWVSFVTFYVLWKSYKHVLELRASGKGGAEAKPEHFTMLVRDIPSASQDQSLNEKVDSYFRFLYPETYYKSMVVTDNKEANKIWVELEGYKKKLARAEVVFAESKSTSKPEGIRPTNKTGFLGLIGEKVDTMDYCNEKIKELLPKLQAEQKVTLREKQKPAALVFFNSRPAAVSASQNVHDQMASTWTAMEATEPRQLLWKNLPKPSYERAIRRIIVYIIVFLAVVFYMIPIVAISAFTTLENLRRLLPFLKTIVDQPKIKTVLEAFLPQIALIVFMALLPMFLMMLSKMEAIPSQSHVIRAASGKYFYFIIFNVFLGVTIGGTLLSTLKKILNEPKQIVTLLGAKLPGTATFFITFVALRFFVGYGLELLRLVPLIMFYLKKKYLCKTEAEVREAWAPGDLNFATRLPNDLLIVTIVLCYSVIAPLIIPFGVVYFGLGWLITRNQVLKVYVPSYESNGRMWPHMHARIVAALVIYQITMFSYIGLKEFYYAPLVLPLLLLSLIFASVCKTSFYPAFRNTPMTVACREMKESPNLEAVYTAYIPLCLRPEKPEDVDQYEDAQSQTSRTVSF